VYVHVNHATSLSHIARAQLSDVVVFAGTAPSSVPRVDTTYVYVDACVCICDTAGVNMTVMTRTSGAGLGPT